MVYPSYQGKLDGLCGMYAITNAICEVCDLSDKETVFKTTCGALSSGRWPNVLWEGTTYRDMQRMLKCVQRTVDDEDLQVKYPFDKNTPSTNGEYWERFDEIFENKATICAILGTTKPSPHWIVVHTNSEGGRVYFLDSSPDEQFFRKNRANLYAGERRPHENSWLIDRKELIVLSWA